MVTSEYLYSERDLAKRIYLYYTDKMLSYLSVGSDNYIEWYKKSCSLLFLVKGLLSIRIDDDGVLTMGSVEINENTLYNFSRKIREYINYEIRELQYIELDTIGNVKDVITLPCAPTYITYVSENYGWQYYLIDITQDGVTEVTLPFDFAEADPNSVRITVNDGDPVYIVDPLEEGVHIIGSTLYWHTFYDLKAGDKLSIQYLKIK